MRNPWMKFYPSDWRGSTSLKLVSMAARGLWIEMICIMHEAEPYGHLMHKDRKLGAKELAALVGAQVDQVSEWLQELTDCGVVETKRNGVLFSRRMENDEIKRIRASEHGKKGGRPSDGKDKEKEDTLKGHAKGGVGGEGKPQKPEARNQKLDKDGAAPKPDDPKLDLKGKPEKTPAAEAVELYNELAGRIGGMRVGSLTDSRRKSLNARLNGRGIELWREALAKVERSYFLCGEVRPKPGERPFRLTLDMLIKPDNFARLMEGFYGDDREPAGQQESEDPRTWSATRWARVMEIYNFGGEWPDGAGPEPGQLGYLGPQTGDEYARQ